MRGGSPSIWSRTIRSPEVGSKPLTRNCFSNTLRSVFEKQFRVKGFEPTSGDRIVLDQIDGEPPRIQSALSRAIMLVRADGLPTGKPLGGSHEIHQAADGDGREGGSQAILAFPAQHR